VTSVAVRRSFPKVPGTPAGPRSRRQFDDEPIVIDRAQLSRDLLTALADGPLMKWQLRDRLHVNEGVIFRTLKKLRAEGHVKVVGKVADKRAWALTTWQRPVSTPVRAGTMTVVLPKKPKGPAESWWAIPNLSREEFSERRRRRDRELGPRE
jgi:hypothetical protein